MQHFDNAAQLKVSGSKGCWLCHAVNEQFRQSQAEFENPPKHHRPDDLRTHHLLLWFAERTETSSGFLDQLRGKSYISYIYGRHTRDVALDPSSEASFDLVKEWVRRNAIPIHLGSSSCPIYDTQPLLGRQAATYYDYCHT
ncbi:unnamed protein product [Alternaria burnsii]|nr:unnamed protein product [Alternaria burnsii]